MKFVIFGLTISSSWGNGHATLWRGLCKALARDGHRVVFFERDVSYYAETRDWHELPGGELVLYRNWRDALSRARRELADADAAIVTSYCPDALAARVAMLDASNPLAVFYDLDTPVTLARLKQGERVPYIGDEGLGAFDLVLSYTGGMALAELRDTLGAQRVYPLYGHVDPEAHHPAAPDPRYQADLSWLGTYAADRQAMLEELFVQPAQLRPQRKFLIAGAQYPQDFPWTTNVYFVRHLPPQEHAAFFSSARLQLNVTRAQMAWLGWCPSGRLFEAAACGAAILSDEWPGLADFYAPDSEILLAHDADETLAALDLDDATLGRIGAAARERTLDEHTSAHRARQLIDFLERTRRGDVAAGSMLAHAAANHSTGNLGSCGA
jgi:spore maturation protein CgeB